MPEPGFPARSGRGEYGPDKVDEKRRRDPRTEFNADQAQLTFWQLGAMGLIAPFAVIVYDGVTDAEVHSHFAWDGTLYTTTNPYVAITKLGTGQYRFLFDANVPNKLGVLQTLAIQGAWAEAMGTAVHALANKRAEADVVATSPGQVDVNVRTAAGALADQDVVLLVF